MKKDEIIRMARAAGFGPAVEWAEMQPPFLCFAALVAAAEREACAQVCESWDDEHDYAGAIRSRGTDA